MKALVKVLLVTLALSNSIAEKALGDKYKDDLNGALDFEFNIGGKF